MAQTVSFPDGTHEVLLGYDNDTAEKENALERILRERLGDDTANLFLEIIEEHKEAMDALENEFRNYECSCDGYRDCLQDVQEELSAAEDLLSEDRIDRKKLSSILSNAQTKITNEL